MSGVLVKNIEYRGEVGDLFTDGRSITVDTTRIPADAKIIEGNGLVAVPAFVDGHVHFRDPGLTDKEDLLSGARAAAAGGYCTVNCEPNTRPVIDSLESVQRFYARLNTLGIPISVTTKAALTLGQGGREFTDIDTLRKYVDVFSDDGEPLLSQKLLTKAFSKLAPYQAYLSAHCEETPRVSERVSAALGAGIPYQREADIVRLHIDALEQADQNAFLNGKLRVQHISLAESLGLILDANRRHRERFIALHGLPGDPRQLNRRSPFVYSEVTPHHLLLCKDDIPQRADGPDANWKMNPPLRSREDMSAMRKALADGLIDFIATDHAPHTPAEKARSWNEAPFGVIGLETAFGVCMSLVHAGELAFDRLIHAMTSSPFAYDSTASVNLTLVDPNHVWTVDPDKFYSKSRNCPFAGMTFKGKPMYTIAGGRVVMAEGEVLF